MTPGKMRDELTAIQERIKNVEEASDRQKDRQIEYNDISFELTEAWEAVERAIEQLDEMIMGLS